MTIGIEAERANLGAKTGVEHYAKQLILHLAKIDRENSYILYLRTKPEAWFSTLPENFRVKVMPFPIFWTQIRISLEMFFHPVDVLLIPASSMPIIHPKKTVVTVHDLAFQYYPETYTLFMRYFHKFEDFLVRRFAWRIIAVSEATKKDFMKFMHDDGKRISLVYHGYTPSLEEHQSSNTRVVNGKQLPAQYIAFLSTLQPRKNIHSLIEALKILKREYPEVEHKLVVAGKLGWKSESIAKELEENKDIVVYLGRVSDSDRWEVLRHADFLALASFYEGFGMQLLEAYEAGIPVLTSNVSSLPEVAGPGAVYVNPHDVQEIKNAMKQLVFDRGLRESLAQKGAAHLTQFSWDRCARETLAVLQDR
jgi:glycosyltransferase involved in cell wall biosynthesis